MAGRWFRIYDEILDDPKVQKLPADLFRMWVNSLALCSRNGGSLPPVEDCAFAFRETESTVSSAFHTFKELGLFVTDGETFQPKNWKKRQYKSDTSTERVRAFRKRSRNGDETSPDTDTDTDIPLGKPNGAKPDSDQVFWANAKAFLAPETKGDPGKLIGAWCRDYGKRETADAVTRAQLERPAQRVPFIIGCLKQSKVKVDDGREWGCA